MKPPSKLLRQYREDSFLDCLSEYRRTRTTRVLKSLRSAAAKYSEVADEATQDSIIELLTSLKPKGKKPSVHPLRRKRS